tara:strand:- start:220 stop:342 length:123 start_codon:yes stop_codon:yes gene_type:complete
MDKQFDNSISIPENLIDKLNIVIKYQNKQLENEITKFLKN